MSEPTLKERADVVKARWSMDMVVEQLIGESVPANRKINSPFNEADETPSFHVYEDSYYDYSTGRHGTVIDLVMALRRCPLAEAIELLESEADELGLEAVERTKAERPPFIMPDDIVTTGPIPGLLSDIDGVSDYVKRMLWESMGVGVKDGRVLAIFHRFNGQEINGIKYRPISGQKWSETGSDYSKHLYQPFWYPMDAPKFCVITEGETDSWAWLSCRPNDHVYSLPAGAATWREAYLEQLEGYEQIYLAFDNDKAGKEAADKVTRSIGWGRAEHVTIPTFYKDVRAAVAAGWTPTLSVAQYSTDVGNLQ